MTPKQIYQKMYRLQRALKRADRIYHAEGGATQENWQAVCRADRALGEWSDANDIQYYDAACEAARRPIPKISLVEKFKNEKRMKKHAVALDDAWVAMFKA